MLKKLEIHSDSDALPEPKTGLRQNCFMPLRERDDNIVKDSSAHLPKKCDSDKNKGEKENKVKLDQSQFCKENKYSETGKKIKNPVNIQEKMQEIEQIAEENDSEICRKIETPSPGPEHLKTDQSGDFETELISNLNYNAAPYFPRAKIASPNPRRGSFNISYYNEAQTLSPLFTSPEPGIFKKKRIAKNELDLSRNGYDRPKPIDLTSRRIKDGVVKWFSPQKGRGIIVVDQPPEEVFFRCETGRPKIWKCGVVKVFDIFIYFIRFYVITILFAL